MKSATRTRLRRLAGILAMFFPLIAARAMPVDPPAEAWRHERISEIVPVSRLSWHVDQHCLTRGSADAKPTETAIVLRFKVGRARYYQAFPVTTDMPWEVGDLAAFVPQTCDIKRRASP